jgi:hypothetical protein
MRKKVQELRNQYHDVSREEIDQYFKKVERELIRFKETMRQRSIYVDVVDEKNLTPSDVTKELVEGLKEGIVIRRRAMQQLVDIPHKQKRKVIETISKIIRNVEHEAG